MTESATCPSEETLAARAAAQLTGEAQASADAHLATCESCRVVVAELARSSSARPKGKTLGRYLLEDVIGSGGMGTVYRAWDPSLRRRVAVKVLHEWRAADASRAQRFLAERQILGGLVHPHIAQLLDGGTTERGTAWFAMELVDGLPIDDFCRQRRLSLRERVKLFLPVCEAVGHAHAHLVVHRDLKPSNVLVTTGGQPKLVDFGIAKLLLDAQGLTQTGLVPMTPSYAAPEQVRQEPVTTASDLYSLAVVLYELLTSVGPYGVPAGDVDATLRAVKHQEARLASSVALAFGDQLRGDLDAILAMALRKEPTERYASVHAFADDLRAWLDGRVTVARSGSRGYRVMKFVQRHKPAVLGVAAVVAALVGGLLTTLWQARQAERERDLAQRRFSELRSLAHAVVFDYHDAIADLAGSTEVRERLVKDALTYLHSLEASAQGDVTLQLELAQALLKIGDVQGDPFSASLGHPTEAQASYREAEALAARVLLEDARNPETTRVLAGVEEKVGALAEVDGRTSEAIEHYGKARARYAQLLESHPDDTRALRAMATQDLAIGQASTTEGRLDDAEAALRRALEGREAVLTREKTPDSRRDVAIARYALGQLHFERGDAEQALPLHREALAALAALHQEQPDSARARRDLAVIRSSHILSLKMTGHLDEGVALARLSVAAVEALVAGDPKNATWRRDLMAALQSEADLVFATGGAGEALAVYERSAALAEALLEEEPDNGQRVGDLSLALSKLGTCEARLKRVAAGEGHCREAIALAERQSQGSANDVEYVGEAWSCLVEALSVRGGLEALAASTRAVEAYETAHRASSSGRIGIERARVLVRHAALSRALAKSAPPAAAQQRLREACGAARTALEVLDALQVRQGAALEQGRQGAREGAVGCEGT